MAQPQSDEDVEDDKPNPRVFLDVEIAEWGEAGRVVIELYADAAPKTKTAENSELFDVDFRCKGIDLWLGGQTL
jgi:hypothetical protein